MDNLEQPTGESVQTSEPSLQTGVMDTQNTVEQPVQQPVQQPPVQQEPQQPTSYEQGESTEQGEAPQQQTPKYDPVGNEVYDTLGTAIVEKGLDPNMFYQEAVAAYKQNGQVEFSEESYQELVKAYGESVANLMEKQFIQEFTSQQNQAKEVATTVYDSFGGEDSFKYVAESVMKEGLLSKADAEELSKLLNKPGVTQKMAIKQLKELYMETSQYQQNPQLANQGTPAQPVGLQPISRREFTKEKMKAMNEKNFALVEQLNRRADYTTKSNPQLWK